MKRLLAFLLAAVVSGMSAVVLPAEPSKTPTLWEIQRLLQTKKFVDLTHTFAPGVPHWPGFPDEKRQQIYSYTKQPGMLGDGFLAEIFTIVGQWGTHVDAPAHFHEGLRTVDQIDPREMILPLVCIDVHRECELNPDYTLTMERIREWEKENGNIPAGAFVAMRTDWSMRWPDINKMENKDQQAVAHYPGWSLATLKFLFAERYATAIGHETTDTDSGLATTKDDYALESYVLGTNHYQIELLANLNQVPSTGALIFVSFAKPEAGSGFPARAIAILP